MRTAKTLKMISQKKTLYSICVTIFFSSWVFHEWFEVVLFFFFASRRFACVKIFLKIKANSFLFLSWEWWKCSRGSPRRCIWVWRLRVRVRIMQAQICTQGQAYQRVEIFSGRKSDRSEDNDALICAFQSLFRQRASLPWSDAHFSLNRSARRANICQICSTKTTSKVFYKAKKSLPLLVSRLRNN